MHSRRLLIRVLSSIPFLLLSFLLPAQNGTAPTQQNSITVSGISILFQQLDTLPLSAKEKAGLQYEKVKAFIQAYPGHRNNPQFILWAKYVDSSRVDSLYHMMAPALQASAKEGIQYQKIRSAVMPGSPFPEMTLADSSNRMFSISSLKGKVVFINVWASWCRPCREEIPQLIALYEKYKDRGLVVIGISLDDDRSKWLAAVKSDRQPWQQFCELKNWWNNPMLRKWGVTGIPYNFIIDRQGNLYDKEVLPGSLERKLRDLL